MNPFVVREVRYNPFEKCGRMFLEDGYIRIVIDGWDRFLLSLEGAKVVLLGLGTVDIMSDDHLKAGEALLSDSKNGFYWMIGKRKFVTPVKRVKMVLAGTHKKAPVFSISSLEQLS